MKRITAFLFAIPAFLPHAMSAQKGSDWFFEVGLGLAIPIDAREAFDAEGSRRFGVGLDLNPTLSLGVYSTVGFFPYNAERLASLFTGPVKIEPGLLGTEVLAVSGELEWSPVESGSWRPTVGVGLGYQDRRVSDSGYAVSGLTWYCNPGTFTALETDPDTGRTRSVVVNPVAHPACPEFRKEIDIASRGMALSGSLGLRWRFVGAEVRYSQGIVGTSAGHLSTHLAARVHF